MRVKRLRQPFFLSIILLCFLIASSLSLTPLSASAISTTLNPTDDAFINENYTDSNYGDDDTIDVKKAAPGYDLYGLIRFDLSSIPADSVIVSAKLRLYATTVNDEIETLYVKRITSDWSESTVTWDNKPSWESEASSSIQNISQEGWYEADVTDDVQGFINGSYPNYGWVLIPAKEVDYDNAKFASKENSNSSIHPQLVIEYVQPNTVTQTETITITQTINNTVTETVTTTVASSTLYTTIYETVSPAYNYGNQTVEYYTDLANQLMPLVMVIGVICTMLSLLLSATKGR